MTTRGLQAQLRASFWRHSVSLKALLDAGAWVVAVLVAYLLRLEEGPGAWLDEALILAALAVPMVLAAVLAFGLNKQSWGHVSTRDLATLAMASATVGVGLVLVGWTLHYARFAGAVFPRSVPFIVGLLGFLLSGFLRLGVRGLREGAMVSRGTGPRVLIVGVGDEGLVLARELDRTHDMRIVGFLHENPLHTGLSYLGHPVLGGLKDVAAVVKEHRIEDVFLALDRKDPHYQEAMLAVRATGVRFRSAPGMEEMLFGKFRPDGAQILPDLLQRAPVQLDDQAVAAMLANKVVLVTGAGGSIGSEIVRQVARYRPERIVLLAHEENSLFELDQELRATGETVARELVVASVRDGRRLDQVFRRHKPHIVFHAAAHKHVPMMEQHPGEAVANNVLGTANLVEMVLHHGVERFVNISTDKAVRPTNSMGASKRVAEMVTTAAAARAAPEQQMVSVRFGNVLGSRGSVIPTWMQQIAHGGPVTVTDERMTRYFMLIPEAVQLVLQAGAMGGRGLVYVLDMGQPVRIADVARQLIRMHGLVPDQDIQVKVTGIRPGEKLYEELLIDGSHQSPSSHPKIFIERADAGAPAELGSLLARLQASIRSGDEEAIRALLLEAAGGQHLAEDGAMGAGAAASAPPAPQA